LQSVKRAHSPILPACPQHSRVWFLPYLYISANDATADAGLGRQVQCNHKALPRDRGRALAGAGVAAAAAA